MDKSLTGSQIVDAINITHHRTGVILEQLQRLVVETEMYAVPLKNRTEIQKFTLELKMLSATLHDETSKWLNAFALQNPNE
jgi:hypothetical protein